MEGGVCVKVLLFDKIGHLTEASLTAFKDGSLDDNDLFLVSDHIICCEKCAAAIADSFNETELAEAPSGFQEEIQNKIKISKERLFEFRIYSLKVATAACIALMIVFSNGLNIISNAITQPDLVKAPNFKAVNSISQNLNKFSQKIINSEVYNYETKKR